MKIFDFKSIIIFVIFGVLIPFLTAYFLFWNPEITKIEIKNEKTPDDYVRVLLFSEETELKKIAKSIRTAFQVPFDLSNYNICFRNRTNFEIAGEKTYLNTSAIITDESGKILLGPINLPKNDNKCDELNLRPPFILKISKIEPLPINENLLSAEIKINFDISADETKGAWPTRLSQIISTFIFMITYGTFLILSDKYIKCLTRSIRKLRE